MSPAVEERIDLEQRLLPVSPMSLPIPIFKNAHRWTGHKSKYVAHRLDYVFEPTITRSF